MGHHLIGTKRTLISFFFPFAAQITGDLDTVMAFSPQLDRWNEKRFVTKCNIHVIAE